jgi:hypothetical protein
MTGYGPERIEQRFSHIPVLQKPVQIEALQSAFANGLSKATIGDSQPSIPRP